MYAIKVKKAGEKAWYFLTPKGGMNKLRIHAGQFATAEKAQTLIDENAADNPDFAWKVVELYAEAANV